MAELETLLFANAAFYRAFSDRDLAAIKAIWRESDDIVCIHPGWGAVRGHDKVLASWAAILSAPESPPVTPVEPFAAITGNVGSVVCFEKLGEGYLIATNLFVLEKGAWRMIHHQAGPTSARPRDETAAETPPQIH